MHFAVVHLEFGTQHRRSSVRVLDKLAKNLKTAGRVSLTIVDNDPQSAATPPDIRGVDAAFYTKGDNRLAEFTGWDVGIRHTLTSLAQRPQAWIFTNDTIGRNHYLTSGKIRYVVDKLLEIDSRRRHWLCGARGRFASSMHLPWGQQQDWISTHLFAISDTLLCRLGSLTPTGTTFEELFEQEYQVNGGLFKNTLPREYSQFLNGWLLSDCPQTQGKWYRAAKISPDTFPMLSRKAKCIVAEHMLTARSLVEGSHVSSYYEGTSATEHARALYRICCDRLIEKLFLAVTRSQRRLRT